MSNIIKNIVSFIRQAFSRDPPPHYSTPRKAPLDIHQEVVTLLTYLTQEHDPKYGFGTVCCNIYDTAWVSMVAKKGRNGRQVWVFPECFETVLAAQESDGGWEPEAGRFDRIAATLAGLLALKQHWNDRISEQIKQEWDTRILKATNFLNRCLSELEALTTTELPIGAELWFPKMLGLLEREGIRLESECALAWLLPICERKMAKLPIDVLYGPGQTSAAHTLEAFIGGVDFGKLRHLKSFGSMLASPSSTAAYLIHSPTWDDEAEAYLRHVISFGSGCRLGGVPTTFPTTVFELAWVSSNILSNNLNFDDQIDTMLKSIGSTLQGILEDQGGLVGFAKDVCPDADDTAKVLTLLSILGTQDSPEPLIKQFESHECFLTFGHERNPSISTNAHVLIALLQMSRGDEYRPQIEKCIRFLSDVIWASDGLVQDKWNISPYYPAMLICQGFVEYIHQCESRNLTPSETLFQGQLPIILYQAMVRILRTQNNDGSWGPSEGHEETAYALLTIKRLLSLPFEAELRDRAVEAVARASCYLEDRYNHPSTRERLWVDKTTYTIQTVAKSYVLGALAATIPIETIGGGIFRQFNLSEAITGKMVKFLTSLPSFKDTPKWIIVSSIREGYMFINELRGVDFFSQKDILHEKYLMYIACCFVASNNRDCYFLSSKYLSMVMEITVATYHLDHFMDCYLMKSSALEISETEQFIHGAFQTLEAGGNMSSSVTCCLEHGHARQDEPEPLRDVPHVRDYLARFMQFILRDEDGKASEYDMLNLRNELRAALLAQIDHVKSSQQLQRDRTQPSNKCGRERRLGNQTFYAWLRGPGCDNVLYPVILKYMIHQMANGKTDVFQTAQEKYLVEDFCRHAAAEVRLWNDLGGVERDKKEGILNSVDLIQQSDGAQGEEILAVLARYENRSVQMCLDELERCMRGPRRAKLMSRLRMHQLVTDVWGEMYSLSKFSVMAKAV